MLERVSVLSDSIQGKLIGDDCNFFGMSIDSKKVKKGNLFVAFRGQKHDGHDFVEEASSMGAAAAIVSKKISSNISQVLVDNPHKAIYKIAEFHRNKILHPIIAITGSNGKTTVKNYLNQILSDSYSTYMSLGNLNNEVGTPLSVSHLDNSYQYSIFEIGAKKLGDIDYLAKLIKPKVGVITNINATHIKTFLSEDNIAKTKGEIIPNVMADGLIVLNKDNRYFDEFSKLSSPREILSFSLNNSDADIYYEKIKYENQSYDLKIKIKRDSLSIDRVPIQGEHNLLNLLISVGIAKYLGQSDMNICQATQKLTSVNQRLNFINITNSDLLIDDTYNANPASTRYALDTLDSQKNLNKVFIFGGMEELGDQSRVFHEQIGEYASEKCTLMIAYGDLAKQSLSKFKGKKLSFESHQEISEYISTHLNKNTAYLLKGSRARCMEKIIKAVKKC